MVSAAFKRSLSLPVANPNPSAATTAPPSKDKADKSYHVRSTSLPCRSHPLVSSLQDEIRSLRSWQSESSSSSSSSAATKTTDSSSLKAGLSRLEILHGALDGLFHLLQTQDSLRRRRRSPYADCLLDDFLHLADAYGRFRESLVGLQQLQSEAQVAVRRRDEDKLGSYVKAQKKVEREVASLASGLLRLREVLGKSQQETAAGSLLEGGDAELVGLLREVRVVVASVSAAVFSGLVGQMGAAAAAALILNGQASSSAWGVLRRRLQVAPKKICRDVEDWERCMQGLKGMEKCVIGLEGGCDRVYRCLINTRVSLLNILTL